MHYLPFIKLSYQDLGLFFVDLIKATIQIKGIDFEKYFNQFVKDSANPYWTFKIFEEQNKKFFDSCFTHNELNWIWRKWSKSNMYISFGDLQLITRLDKTFGQNEEDYKLYRDKS
jgi:hypothetical protein